MAVETGIYELLRDAAAVSALVSGRIYPQAAPQNAELPYAIFSVIGRQADIAHSGVTGCDRWVFSVEASAATYEGAKALAAAIRGVLTTTAVKTGIGVILPDDEFDSVTFRDGAGDSRIHTVAQQFVVWAG